MYRYIKKEGLTRMETTGQADDKWNYFQSLYFCYTTFLTIGYGDFHPTSNAAKPFFVIWSLLAVPMLTILISNLGDTVIAWIKNLTLWIGEWTVLPAERVPGESQEGRWSRIKPKLLRKSEQSPDGGNPSRGKEVVDAIDDPGAAEEKRDLEAIGEGLVREEKQEEEEAEQNSDEHDPMIDLHHDLATAINRLLPDLAAKERRQYEFEEWSGYLKLVYRAGQAGAPMPPPSGPRGRSRSNEMGEHDWLGEDSPLMSRRGETEWLLTKLCGRLEECLRERRNMERQRAKGKSRG